MTITLTEQTGTAGNDSFTGASFTAKYGLAGDDTFTTSNSAASSAIEIGSLFAGGNGSDTYTVNGFGSEAYIYDTGRNGSDTLVTNLSFSSSYAAIIDGKHLVAYDPAIDTFIYEIDWINGGGIETYQLSDATFSASELRANLTSLPGFTGYYDWGAAVEGFVWAYSETEMVETVSYYMDRAKDMSELSLITDSTNTVYRFYNASTSQHFYTLSADEARYVATDLDSYELEGAAFASASGSDAADVFRFYNSSTNAHFYTISEGERDFVLNNLPTFQYEGVSYQAYENDNGSNTALYRFYNETTGTHFYTASEGERDFVISSIETMNYEGIAYYVDDIA